MHLENPRYADHIGRIAVAAVKPSLAPFVLLLALLPTAAAACFCSPGETGAASPETTVAFVGRPVAIEVIGAIAAEKSTWNRLRGVLDPVLGSSGAKHVTAIPREFLGSVRVTFEVSQYLKGSGPTHIPILSGYGDSDCGLDVSISKKYEIYARRINGALRTSYCFGSTEYKRGPAAPQCSDS